jgi:hypothetical protein
MDVSFILSADEIYTLMSYANNPSEAGRKFADAVLSEAKLCDLNGLVEKQLAKHIAGELDLAPVIRMVADALACADRSELHGDVWNIQSSWVSLRCEKYPYKEKHYKITPLKEGFV